MSLQSRLAALIAAIGADIKDLRHDSGSAGFCSNPGEETRTAVPYGTMDTPDVVPGIVIEEGDILRIGVQAMVKETTDTNGRAALFIGSQQLKVAKFNQAAPVAQEARITGGNSIYQLVTTGQWGLVGAGQGGSTAYTGDVTTGQVLGVMDNVANSDNPDSVTSAVKGFGFCEVQGIAPGTYDISLQFKASNGITAKNRKLWVEVVRFVRE